MSTLFGFFRIRSKNALQTVRSASIVQKHSGIIQHIRFGDTHFFPVHTFHHQRTECKPLAIPFRERNIFVSVFERIVELLLKCVFSSVSVVDISHKKLLIFRKIENRRFVFDNERLFHCRYKTIGYTIIVSSENKLIITFKTKNEFIIVIYDFIFFVNYRSYLLIYGLFFGF